MCHNKTTSPKIKPAQGFLTKRYHAFHSDLLLWAFCGFCFSRVDSRNTRLSVQKFGFSSQLVGAMSASHVQNRLLLYSTGCMTKGQWTELLWSKLHPIHSSGLQCVLLNAAVFPLSVRNRLNRCCARSQGLHYLSFLWGVFVLVFLSDTQLLPSSFLPY